MLSLTQSWSNLKFKFCAQYCVLTKEHRSVISACRWLFCVWNFESTFWQQTMYKSFNSSLKSRDLQVKVYPPTFQQNLSSQTLHYKHYTRIGPEVLYILFLTFIFLYNVSEIFFRNIIVTVLNSEYFPYYTKWNFIIATLHWKQLTSCGISFPGGVEHNCLRDGEHTDEHFPWRFTY